MLHFSFVGVKIYNCFVFTLINNLHACLQFTKTEENEILIFNDIFSIIYYLRQGGYVFAWVCL